MTPELLVLLGGRRAGAVHQNPNGLLSFDYAADYADDPAATPLSLSMPLTALHHEARRVRPYLAGLLPDNPDVLRRWGREFGASPENPFALLAHVGLDVAGAIQLVPPDRLDDARAPGRVTPVDDDYIEDRLRTLRQDRSAWEPEGRSGRFSLAGAQAKFALHRDGTGAWGLPDGRAATTHILKPAMPGYEDQDLVEHICLDAAGRMGLLAARTWVGRFGEERAFVAERYDRVTTADSTRRIHQEDLCQALAVHPDRKYEDEGGPGVTRVIALLREAIPPAPAREAVARFVAALALNWVVLGPDAHAKNYSLLLDGPDVRLAPLYDVTSVLPYADRHRAGRVELAMAVGGQRRASLVTARHWRELARKNQLDTDEVFAIATRVATAAPAAFTAAAAALPTDQSDSTVLHQLLDGLAERSEHCVRLLS
jgi:serine/threonine-protein kinase HipA